MAALLSGMVVAVTHAAAVYIEELFHAVDYGWSTIELLQKTQKKQAKFEAEERPKRGRAPTEAQGQGSRGDWHSSFRNLFSCGSWNSKFWQELIHFFSADCTGRTC